MTSELTSGTEFDTVADFRSQLVEWLDSHDLTPPPGDHSLDAHQAQHARVLKSSTTRAGCAGAGRNPRVDSEGR